MDDQGEIIDLNEMYKGDNNKGNDEFTQSGQLVVSLTISGQKALRMPRRRAESVFDASEDEFPVSRRQSNATSWAECLGLLVFVTQVVFLHHLSVLSSSVLERPVAAVVACHSDHIFSQYNHLYLN